MSQKKPQMVKVVLEELEFADMKHPPMAEKIEGLHTLKCEVAELEREIMRHNFSHLDMVKEATQVAAMALKFLRDCCDMEVPAVDAKTFSVGETEQISQRGHDWIRFATMVLNHIETYTVPQYGDKGSDRATEYTLEEIADHIGRYRDRIGSNARGTVEAKRDMLKIAHYASFGLDLID